MIMNQTDIYISADDTMHAANITAKELDRLRTGHLIGYRITAGVGHSYEYRLSDLSLEARQRYWAVTSKSTFTLIEGDAEIYATAPEYARKKADKYIAILNACKGINGTELKEFVTKWNQLHPDMPTSYPSITKIRIQFKTSGISALLGNYGHRSCASIVPDELFEYFKSMYLSDGRPSVTSCWKVTHGYAIGKGMDVDNFPSPSTFSRRLEKEVPAQAVYTAREGVAAANRKYGFFIKRDYKDLLAGECWISDHAQIDVACTYQDNGKTKVGYPWVTAWRDFKSGLWTGWDLHMEGPNSDFIFMSFYRAALRWGIPKFAYLDNGKDYRCKDFAGGRKKYRVNVDEVKTTSLTGALGITTIFAWPYNAQAKAIERDFNRNKEWFSKLAPGYRGGDVVERPEAHNATIASGKIMTFEQLEKHFNSLITDIIHKTPVSSGYRKDKCPQELWDEEYPQAVNQGKVRTITKTALMLFCTRTSSVKEIGRRGFHDASLDVDYYADWMSGQHGRKVYLRRDPKAMQDAFVFDAVTNEFIGSAELLNNISAITQTDVSKVQLKEQIDIKRSTLKLSKAMAKGDIDIPYEDVMAHLKRSTDLINKKRGYIPSESVLTTPITVTPMDHVNAKIERQKSEGLQDYSSIVCVEEPRKKRTLIAFESEKTTISGQIAANS
jgi:putative transposase